MSCIAINDLKTTDFDSFIEEFDNEIPEILGGCCCCCCKKESKVLNTLKDVAAIAAILIKIL